MNWWIVILLLAVALSPLTWLVPTRRQRGAMQLRLQARQMGLAMQLAQQDWPYWLASSPPKNCAQYYRVRPKGRVDQWCYWQSEPGQWFDRWREPCTDEALLEQLCHLPADVYKVEAGVQLVSLYWGECGDAIALQHIARFLNQSS